MNYVSINTIADRISRHPLLEDVQFETIVDYAAEFMRSFGIPKTFEEKVAILEVIDFKAPLPCDYFKVNQVRGMYGVYRASTDSFHMSFGKPSGDYTYKIQNSCIITSVEKDTLEMSYQVMPVDSDGYLLIPDNSPYQKALELYIKLQCFTVQFDLGKIAPAVLQNTQRDYAAAIGLAHSDILMPTVDEMETLSHIHGRWLTDIPVAHQTGYKYTGNKQILKRH